MIRIQSPLDELTESQVTAVIDSGIAVHRELGPGFVESIYRNAFCLELEAQVLSYLKATGLRVGLLMNFGGSTLAQGLRRFVL